jgi:hypothetical protein
MRARLGGAVHLIRWRSDLLCLLGWPEWRPAVKTAPPVETPLPQNVEAERALLDSVMLDPSTLPDVRAICSPDSLYIHEHRTIFRAMCDLADAGAPIDTVTLIDELERTGQLEDAGGGAAVGALGTNAPDNPHAVAYARIVQRCALTLHGGSSPMGSQATHRVTPHVSA